MSQATDAHSTSSFFWRLSPNVNILADPYAEVTPGCDVFVFHSLREWEVGRYWPGPPAEFAPISPDEIFSEREDQDHLMTSRPLGKKALVCPILEVSRRMSRGTPDS